MPPKQQPQRRVVLLIGLPGSGKSTVSNLICSTSKQWFRVSQDELGSREECKKQMIKALKQNLNVLVDRCNAHAKERKMWFHDIVESKLENVQMEAFFLNTSVEICKQRVLTRKDHPNLKGEAGAGVIDQFVKNLEAPNPREGFKVIYVASAPDEVKQQAKLLLNAK